jgi:hypothetical protein
VQAGITDNNALIVAAILGINFGNSIPPVIMSMNQEARLAALLPVMP